MKVSISGVGLLTAAVAVAELPPVEKFDHAGQTVAFAGLDPSGDTHRHGSAPEQNGIETPAQNPLHGRAVLPA